MSRLAVFALLVCFCGQGKANNAQDRAEFKTPQEAVNAWMDTQPLKAGAVTVALVTPDSTKFFSSGNVSSQWPHENTLFEIASITKGFTGMLLADQLNLGKVKLNDTLSTLLTDWPGRFTSPAGKVTLLQLATHTSGLEREPPNMGVCSANTTFTVKELYAWLDSVQDVTPGKHLYSNAGFWILGQALAVTAGSTYEALLKERVLIPLGLIDTAVVKLSFWQKYRLAPGHDSNGSTAMNYDCDVAAPGGGLRSSVKDFAQFLQVATGIVPASTPVLEMIDRATQNWGKQAPEETWLSMGLGWMRSTGVSNQLGFWHGGNTYGYESFVFWFAEQKKGVVVLSSSNAGTGDSAENLAHQLLRLM